MAVIATNDTITPHLQDNKESYSSENKEDEGRFHKTLDNELPSSVEADIHPCDNDIDGPNTETPNETDGNVRRGGAGANSSDDSCKRIYTTAIEEVQAQPTIKMAGQGSRSSPQSQTSPQGKVF